MSIVKFNVYSKFRNSAVDFDDQHIFTIFAEIKLYLVICQKLLGQEMEAV